MSDKPEEKCPEHGAHLGAAMATQPKHRLSANGCVLLGIGDHYVLPRGNIRVPETDEHWRVVRDFVTEPGPDHHHASEFAFEPLTGAGSKTDSARAQDLSWRNPPIRFSQTKDNRTIWAIYLGWSGTTLQLKTCLASQVRRVSMLGFHQPLKSHSNGTNGLVIDLPTDLPTETDRPCKTAWVFRFEMKTE